EWYNGGMEHTTLHLLYSRFWHLFLNDIGVVPNAEPYAKRTSHGMILGENGEKMSKSRGNVINPDDIIRDYGADTMRVYEMFIGDFEKAAPWSMSSIKGSKRFLEKVFSLNECLVAGDSYRKETETEFHKTIKKVSSDIENLKMNTAIASLMSLLNTVTATGSINKAELKDFIIMLNPFAPHITEEMWEIAGFGGMLNEAKWPEFDESKCADSSVEIAVQVNGKIRARINVPADISNDDAIALAKSQGNVAAEIKNKTVIKELYIPKRLVNIVVK
ncbi:MAG: class I tRNA ligase family protein, partial [Clostridia bacterium]|nr:class I tRNA ligase family protein [Clostridia bacterium]